MVKYIVDFYKEMDCDVWMYVGGNGVVVMIDIGKLGKIFVICVDFDVFFI